MEHLVNQLAALNCRVEPCGSRVTCTPAPADTDQDYLVQIADTNGAIASVVDLLSAAGFVWEGSEHYQSAASNDFMSWRKGDVNLIVTANASFAKRHRAATFVCTRLNLLNKEDRISLFQAVLYGTQWDGKSDLSPPPVPETHKFPW